MPEIREQFTRHFDATVRILGGRGLLLGAYDRHGRANAMTIGWATMGISWGMPVWVVMVRPSRYTYECIESAQTFSVCVPGPELAEACRVCGSRSGRDRDKLSELGLEAARGRAVACPDLLACPIVYECSVVHAGEVDPKLLVPQINASAYANGDYHRVYWGRVDGVRIDPDAAERLRE